MTFPTTASPISLLPINGPSTLADILVADQSSITGQSTLQQVLTLFNGTIQISAGQVTGLGTAAFKAASNNAKPNLASIVTPVVINQLAVFSDTAGTISGFTLSGAAGISVNYGSGTIILSGSGSGIGWNDITGSNVSMIPNSGYTINNSSTVTLTLPVNAAYGTSIAIIGKNTGNWIIQCGVGQTIVIGKITTSSGGNVSSTNPKDSINLICTSANTIWTTLGGPQGNLTIA